jgi:hypothetical protein
LSFIKATARRPFLRSVAALFDATFASSEEGKPRRARAI